MKPASIDLTGLSTDLPDLDSLMEASEFDATPLSSHFGHQVAPSSLTILCGDFFRRADVGLWDIGRLMAKTHGFGFRSFRNHTKLILAKIANTFYVVESSANLRSCHNVEQFTMTQSRELFEFHRGWIKQQIWKGAKE